MRYSEFGSRPSYKATVELDDDEYVGVNYQLSGPWPDRSNSKLHYLLDDPEIFNIQVFNIDTGEDITSNMTPRDISRIKDSITTDHSKETRGY